MLFAIFFYITMIRALVLAFCMTLAFMFALSMLALVLAVCALAFGLTFSVTLALVFAFCVLALMLAIGALTFVLAFGMTLAFMFAGSLTLALVLTVSMALAFVLTFLGSMTTSSRILATSGQFLTCSRIGLYGISIITDFADFLAQLVRICFLGIVIDRDLCRIGIIGIIFHPFEERNVIFETVNAFLAFQGSVGLDGYALHLCISTQSYYGHQGHQNKFFHFYCFINY